MKTIKYENHFVNAEAVASKKKADFIKEEKDRGHFFTEYDEEEQTLKLEEIWDKCKAEVDKKDTTAKEED